MPAGPRRYCAKVERLITDGDVDTSPDRWEVIAWRYWVSKEAAADQETEEGKGLGHTVTFMGHGNWMSETNRPKPQDRLTIGAETFTVRECVDPTGQRKELRLRFSQMV